MNANDFLRDLFAAYPHFKPPDPERTIRVYLRGIRSIPDWKLEHILDALLAKGGRFFPTIPEIQDAAHNVAAPEPLAYTTPEQAYWRRMSELSAALRGAGSVPDLPEGVTTEWDDLSAEELERLADEKAGYLEKELF